MGWPYTAPMNLIASVLALIMGLACFGAAVRVVRRGAPVFTSTGLVWPTARRAGGFWLLLGLGLVSASLITYGASAGTIGADAGFWLSGLPLVFGVAALVAFHPQRTGPDDSDGPDPDEWTVPSTTPPGS